VTELFPIHTYNYQIMLIYCNIWHSYANWTETTQSFVKCEFYAALLTVAFFIKTTTTVYQLKTSEVTVAKIKLADKLIILLIFANNEHLC